MRPVAATFSARWSTATLLGAAMRTFSRVACRSSHTSVVLVTVLPVPGGPWIMVKGCCSAACSAASCEWLGGGMPGAWNAAGRGRPTGPVSGSWPRSWWKRKRLMQSGFSANVFRPACMRSYAVAFQRSSAA